MSLNGKPKDIVDINDGVTIARTTTGAVIVTDREGKTKAIDGPDAVQWLFYTIKGEFPEPPRTCDVEEAIRRQQAHTAREEARIEEERNTAIVTMSDGSKRRVKINQLEIPSIN